MDPTPRSPIAESPWFWVLIFSCMGILATLAIQGQYGRRQARLELQYQARERTAQKPAEGPARREFSSPGDTLIPLWPLAAVLAAVAVVSLAMLLRQRQATQAAERGRAAADARPEQDATP